MVWFEGTRSFKEQMMGLECLNVSGKTVLDLGCAEGHITAEMIKAGAIAHGVECNEELEVLDVPIWVWNLNNGLPPGLLPEYDIVLLLAILHKLRTPEEKLRTFAGLAKERVVIRLPSGSIGMVRSKHFPKETCFCIPTMQDCGFRLEETFSGPRGELVQHWIRG